MKLQGIIIPLIMLNMSMIGRRYGQAHAFQIVRTFSRKSNVRGVVKNGFGVGSNHLGLHNDKEKDPGSVVGTKLRVLKYPNPLLRAKNLPVTNFDENLANITKQLLLIMYAADGIGLAAPQVGINQRIMVFNPNAGHAIKSYEKQSERVMINPIITEKSTDIELGEEGCLSFPNIYAMINRNIWINVKYFTIDGEIQSERIEGYPAVVFQHEYDHLDGILFIDHMNSEDKEKNHKLLRNLIYKYGSKSAL